jgi:hypothetical protein
MSSAPIENAARKGRAIFGTYSTMRGQSDICIVYERIVHKSSYVVRVERALLPAAFDLDVDAQTKNPMSRKIGETWGTHSIAAG